MNTFSSYFLKTGEFGIVEQIHHPIVVAGGLPGAKLHEIVIFESGQMGEVFLLEKDSIQILVFSKNPIRTGTKVIRTNKSLSTPVGRELLGKTVDPLGNPLSTSEIYKKPSTEREIDTPPPGIMKRSRIKEPFLTGVTIVDMMMPLGRGQKELVIGDRKTGKTSFLLTTIKTQVKSNSIAIYAAIGKKKSDIKKIQEFFEKENIKNNTVIVATTSYDSPSLIFLTPFSAMAIAEHYRDLGMNVTLILDDLSTHAKFYREISLIAKRFPGRDSYPGDIFHTHARLLERAGNFIHEKGDISITLLPVVEITEGDLTSYIATNLMGMTDGHIFFDSNVFYKGRRPAINIPLSVTRVGRQSQSLLIRSINRELTAFLALFEKMQTLSHFGAELTEGVQQILTTGETIYNFFDQPISLIIPIQVQLILFSMIWLKLLDNSSIEKVNNCRDLLIKAYYNEETKPVFDEILKAKTFNELLGNISRKQDVLLSICKTNVN